MTSENSSCDSQTIHPAKRRLSGFLRPGLGTIALIGALTWAVGLWAGPYLMPGPGSAEATARDFERDLVPLQSVYALTVPDGMAEHRPVPVSRSVEIRRGDTLMKVLTGAGIGHGDAHAAITALREVFDPRALTPGMTLDLSFQPLTPAEGSPESFRGLEFQPSAEKTMAVARTWDNGFKAFVTETPLTPKLVRASGPINSSLYVDALESGVPPSVVIELIRAMSFDVDFQREIRTGDEFEILFAQMQDPDGNTVSTGNVVFAALTLSGKRLPIYRYKMDDGTFDYFNGKGESTRKALMRTPIDGARLSSGFGRRRHPILGYTRMHKGTDFAAPSGTPIMAAGRGIVVSAGWNGGYGRYVRIRHNATYSTAYAHMKGFARGIARGARVSQGQVIGYVGTTGRSTGPHLHYEVLENNRQVNPLSLKLPTGKTLTGKELKDFLAFKGRTDKTFAGLGTVAESVPGTPAGSQTVKETHSGTAQDR